MGGGGGFRKKPVRVHTIWGGVTFSMSVCAFFFPLKKRSEAWGKGNRKKGGGGGERKGGGGRKKELKIA